MDQPADPEVMIVTHPRTSVGLAGIAIVAWLLVGGSACSSDEGPSPEPSTTVSTSTTTTSVDDDRCESLVRLAEAAGFSSEEAECLVDAALRRSGGDPDTIDVSAFMDPLVQETCLGTD